MPTILLVSDLAKLFRDKLFGGLFVFVGFKFQFCFILCLQEKASQVVYDDRISVLHFPQPHIVPRQYYPVSPPPDSQQFVPLFFNIGLTLIFLDPVCNQVLSDL